MQTYKLFFMCVLTLSFFQLQAIANLESKEMKVSTGFFHTCAILKDQSAGPKMT